MNCRCKWALTRLALTSFTATQYKPWCLSGLNWDPQNSCCFKGPTMNQNVLNESVFLIVTINVRKLKTSCAPSFKVNKSIAILDWVFSTHRNSRLGYSYKIWLLTSAKDYTCVCCFFFSSPNTQSYILDYCLVFGSLHIQFLWNSWLQPVQHPEMFQDFA